MYPSIRYNRPMNRQVLSLKQRIDDLNLYPPSWDHHPLGQPDLWPVALKVLLLSIIDSPFPAYLCWGEDRFFFFNKAYQPLLIGKQQNSFGAPFPLVWPEVWAELAPLFEGVNQGQTFYFRDHLLRLNRTGTEEDGYFDFTFSPAYEADGSVIGLLCLCSETTDRRLAEISRITAEEEKVKILQDMTRDRVLFHNFFKDAPVSAAILEGPEHVFSYANDGYENLVANRPLKGLSVREAFPELAEQGFYQLLDNVYTTGVSYYASETRVKLTNEDQEIYDIDIDLIYAARRNQDGVIEGISVFAIDISDKIKARTRLQNTLHSLMDTEEKLRLSQESLDLALKTAKMGTWHIDLKNQIMTTSESAAEIFGMPEINENVFDLIARRIHPADQGPTNEAWTTAVAKGSHYYKEYRLIQPDGSSKWAYSEGSTKYDADGKPIYISGVLGDIDERVRARHDLENAKREAERANQTKSWFLANMSHEIRTPLGAILGFTELMREQNLTIEDRERFLDTISRNGKSLTRIIDDILDLAKVESGRLETEMIEFSLHLLVEEVCDLFRERALAKSIYLRSDIAQNIPEHIITDPSRLRQILINIVGNALKFTETGGVKIAIRSEGISENYTKITIAVQDSGVGLSKVQAEKLFQPFVQADNSTTRKFGGTGLGLHLSQRLA
ncbi:MAG: PAS domain S-box protein, partial [Proteobacteria bacterium]